MEALWPLTLLLSAFAVVALFVWARWLRRKAVAPPAARWIAFALVAVAAGSIVMELIELIAWYGSISGESSDPSLRLRIVQAVAAGTTDAAYNAAFVDFFPVSWLLFVTWRWHWSRREPRVPGDPPYR